jgi:hypothetical protein
MYVEKAAPTITSSSGRVQFRSAAERKLTDRPLDVKCNARHFRERGRFKKSRELRKCDRPPVIEAAGRMTLGQQKRRRRDRLRLRGGDLDETTRCSCARTPRGTSAWVPASK